MGTFIGHATSTGAESFDTSSFDKNGKSIPGPLEEENLYAILGLSMNATKSEMRRQYVALARITHPDALIGNNSTKLGPATEFSQIARAYKILSDSKEKKRYDRSLAAKDFTKNIERAAAVASDAVGPQVKRVLDDFAMPFLKRTTATAVAGVSAAAENLSDGSGGLDIGSAVSSAFKAGERVNKLLDGVLLREKSIELEKKAEEELEKAYELTEKISEVSKERLSLSLRIENSALSSEDAIALLVRMNATNKSAPIIERLGMKHTLEEDIRDLEKIEIEHYEEVAGQAEAVQKFHIAQNALKAAAQDAKDAVEEENAARKALEAAQKRVQSTKQNVNDLRKSFSKIRTTEKKATDAVEATSVCLVKRQEKVRVALLNRGKLLNREEELDKEVINNEALEEVKSLDLDTGKNSTMIEIEDLRKQERALQAERTEREERAAKMILKAKALSSQADEIDRTKGRTKVENLT
eukprot:CAMPEP_0194224754 /NCGR_PEP_ID=MMETSP0156-20130528/38079_1 /TAXON_ID=33649 /ORGANISM="Thalassionema nitzschioides, Strain L26-B" /LENGTH=468 /DNA_ID=CAMNT_0038956447 /DNA_START=169 /DNA_END=1575 /DNA_ORIENTATION=+